MMPLKHVCLFLAGVGMAAGTLAQDSRCPGRDANQIHALLIYVPISVCIYSYTSDTFESRVYVYFCMGHTSEMCTEYRSENLKERDLLEDKGLDRKPH
jgi:hypothetical protein